MLISIIVPVYNVEKYLRQCLDSLIKQTYKNIEIVIIDDGSTDNSGKICDEYEKKNKNIKVIHKKNEGLGLARNTGLELIKGEYVMFVDSDDYVSNEICEVLLNNMNNNNYDYCKCGYCSFDNNGKLFSTKKYCNEKFYENDSKFQMMARMIGSLPDKKDVIEPSVWACIYKADIIKKYNIKFPSERELISEDIVFNLEYMEHVQSSGIIDYCGYFYRFNPKSLSKSYKKDRYDKIVYLYDYLYNRLTELKYNNDAFIRLNTLFFVNLKVIISQEKNSNKSAIEIKKTIDYLLNNEKTRKIINEYPINQQHFKQRLFLYFLKYKMSFTLLFLLKINIL